MKLIATALSALAIPAVFAAENAKAAHINPLVGDVSHGDTMYSLYTYSEPGYRGKAARIEPHECTALGEHGIKAKSIQFTGNNCCFFFPKDDCSNLHAGQRVIGNIPDTSAWGFPHGIGAVKCLSHAACSVMKHQACDLDRHCSQYEEQSKCPFVSSCSAYSPVHPSDWSKFALPPVTVDEETGYEYKANPVRETFFVTGDGDAVNIQAAHGVSPLDHHRHHLAATGAHQAPAPPKPLEKPTLLEPSQGGTDNYDQGTVAPHPGLPKKAAKKADKAAKKEAKKKYKQDMKQYKKLSDLFGDYDSYYSDDGEYDEEYDY